MLTMVTNGVDMLNMQITDSESETQRFQILNTTIPNVQSIYMLRNILFNES